MDDGSLERTEEEVRSRLGRDLRAIEVAPYAHYRSAAERRMQPRPRALRVAGALAVAVTVVVLALAAGPVLMELRRNVAASPSPSVAPPTSTPATSEPAPGDRYGYVFTFGDSEDRRFAVRRERDGAVVFERAGDSPAVSPDGKRLAYWRRTTDAGATDLRVLDVADPRTDRSVLTLTGGTTGGGIVWSNDGLGLLIETHNRPTFGECLPSSSLLMVDLTTTPAATRSAGSGGCVLLPLAWDRPGRAAAGVVTGPGGYATAYVSWNGSAAEPVQNVALAPYAGGGGYNQTALLAGSLRASSDAKYVVAVESSLSVWRVWPLLDSANAVRIARAGRTGFPLWRGGTPETYELVYGIGPRAELVTYPSEATSVLYTIGGSVGVLAVRPDGSGALLQEGPAGGATMPPPPITYRLTVVDIATKRITDVTSMTGGISVLPRGVLLMTSSSSFDADHAQSVIGSLRCQRSTAPGPTTYTAASWSDGLT